MFDNVPKCLIVFQNVEYTSPFLLQSPLFSPNSKETGLLRCIHQSGWFYSQAKDLIDTLPTSSQPPSEHHFKENYVETRILQPKWENGQKGGLGPRPPNFLGILKGVYFLIFSLTLCFQQALNQYQIIIFSQDMTKKRVLAGFGTEISKYMF